MTNHKLIEVEPYVNKFDKISETHIDYTLQYILKRLHRGRRLE